MIIHASIIFIFSFTFTSIRFCMIMTFLSEFDQSRNCRTRGTVRPAVSLHSLHSQSYIDSVMIMTPPPPPLRRRSDARLSDRNDTQAIGLYYDTSHLSCAETCGQTFRFSGALLPACACACARCPVLTPLNSYCLMIISKFKCDAALPVRTLPPPLALVNFP